MLLLHNIILFNVCNLFISVKILVRGNVKTPIERVKTVNPIQSKIKSLLQQKSVPKHIARLDNDVQTDVLINKTPQSKNGEFAINISVAEYPIIEKIDEKFYDAVNFADYSDCQNFFLQLFHPQCRWTN